MIASRWLRLGAVASALSLGCGDSPPAPDGSSLDASLDDTTQAKDMSSRVDRLSEAGSDRPMTPCTESPCGVGLTCCAHSGRCYDPGCHTCCEAFADGGSRTDAPLPAQDGACVGNQDCPAASYCAGDSCGVSGRCVERPTGCTTVRSLVCGCDGVTRVNACAAAAAGARIAQRGECVGPHDASVDAVGDGRTDALSAACARVLCSVGMTCCDLPGAPAYGSCFDPTCRTCCAPVSGMDSGTPLFDAHPGDCLSNADCRSPLSFCAGPGCGVRGVCEPRPRECPGIFDPVCGCDGRTYSSPCEAGSAGLRVSSRGACLSPSGDSGLSGEVSGPDGAVSICAAVRCAVGTVCCDIPRSPSYGGCYDARCATCCR